MKNAIIKILLGLTAIACVSATIFIDSKMSVASNKREISRLEVLEKGSDAKLENDGGKYSISSGQTGRLTFVIDGNSVFRLSPNTTISFAFNEKENFEKEVIIALQAGRLWINTLSSALSAQVLTKYVSVNALPGIFDIKRENNKVSITALRHSAEVSFINIANGKLVLPETRSQEFLEDKISAAQDVIAKLRYSKLLKEFPYFSLPNKDDWTRENQISDETFINQYDEKIAAEVRSGGLKVSSDDSNFASQLHDGIRAIDLALTFDNTKKEEKEINRVFDYFDSGVYFAQIGDADTAALRFAQFQRNFNSLSSSAQKNKKWLSGLAYRLDRYAYFQPKDSLFQAKETIREVAKNPLFESYVISFNDILDMAASGKDTETTQNIITLLRRFGAYAKENIKQINDQTLTNDVFFLSVLIDDFLSRYPTFLKEEFLKIAELFESTHLDLIASREELKDQRQFFISVKLNRIKALISLMQSGDMPFQDARTSILLMADQIEALKPTFTDSAVLTYFDEQLADLLPIISFLRTSDAKHVTGNFKENFDNYQKRLVEINKVLDLLSTAAGGTQITASRREELAGIVMSDLGGIDATNIKIVLPESEDDSKVKISSAVLEGKTFSCNYDTSRKLFSDLIIDGAKIKNSVRLDNFKKFYLLQIGKLVLTENVTADSLSVRPEQVSLLEKVAKEKLFTDLTALDIAVEEKYLGMENVDDGIIHVNLAVIDKGEEEKMFSFDIEQKKNIVSNLKVQTVAGSIPVNDTFQLKEIKLKVQQIYQSALLEKLNAEEKAAQQTGTSGVKVQRIKTL